MDHMLKQGSNQKKWANKIIKEVEVANARERRWMVRGSLTCGSWRYVPVSGKSSSCPIDSCVTIEPSGGTHTMTEVCLLGRFGYFTGWMFGSSWKSKICGRVSTHWVHCVEVSPQVEVPLWPLKALQTFTKELRFRQPLIKHGKERKQWNRSWLCGWSCVFFCSCGLKMSKKWLYICHAKKMTTDKQALVLWLGL